MAKTEPDIMARRESRLAWTFVLPAVGVVAIIAIFPLLWTLWISFHRYDLRGLQPNAFIGFGNYFELLRDARFWGSLWHTTIFAVGSVSLELLLGTVLALALNRTYRGRGLVRTAVLLPWAIPTVVVALLWSFMFDSRSGIANSILIDVGMMDGERPFIWFLSSVGAWVPIILADVWQMTPFVTLLLLAGLQNIDTSLYEAAQIDGASRWQQFIQITLPLLKPAIVVVLIFRTLDAFRVFALIYVLTGGGPGTATEPISLYAFDRLLDVLRFGYGSAISVVIFLITFALAVLYIKALGANLTGRQE